MNLLRPWVLARLFSGAATVALCLIGAIVAARVLRYWRVGATSEGQLALERRAELVAAVVQVALIAERRQREEHESERSHWHTKLPPGGEVEAKSAAAQPPHQSFALARASVMGRRPAQRTTPGADRPRLLASGTTSTARRARSCTSPAR